jgi:HEAT repeat protein
VLLEGSSHISVLFRVANRTVEKIRAFPLDCELDAGGLPVVWFDRVPGTESLSLLSSLDNNSTVAAIAMHAGGAAGALLEKYASQGEEKRRRDAIFWLVNTRISNPGVLNQIIQIARRDPSPNIRGHALFWLAQKAGDKAAGTIAEAIRSDPDTQVKERAVFALSQLPKDQGIPLLIDQARTNKNPVVRKRALFWLGQSRDPRALAFIEEILTR